MNDARRKALDAIVKQIEAGQAMLESAIADLETIRDEEQEAYDNLPEGLRDGDKGEAMSMAIDNIQAAIDELQGAIDNALSDACTCIAEAQRG